MEEVIKTMAVIDQNTNKVINLISGNESSPTRNGTFLVEVTTNVYCNIGFTYDGQNFLDENGFSHMIESAE